MASEAPIVTPQCPQDWDPRSDDVIRDPLAAYDGLRARCPMAWSGLLGWTLTDNAGIRAVLQDPETFSNSVSRHLSVPNGMDPPQHTPFRRLVERYFEPAEVAGLEPELDGIARELAEAARGAGDVDLVSDFCEPFAVRAQCAFLGWPRSVEARLAEWARRNEAATREQDRQALAEIAAELDALVVALLDERRALGDDAPPDRTTRLLHEQVDGRRLTDAEIVSILRNWTMGEVGTLAASLGIIGAFLAGHPAEQERLRADPAAVPDAIEEILRLHGPLLANRRRVTRDTTIAGQPVAAGDRVTLLWVPANRDPAAFSDPLAYRPERDQSRNLLWGEGLHVCPGAPLARLELQIAVRALLDVAGLAPQPQATPQPAAYPASGFAFVPLRLE
ncbi:cytochrome P450 [Spiribacter halobius]|uniref:Cytochrome P450 n=1 Tax=Sediminicurvatus halobius TaxID=2182432 RepID=A0A2U2MVN9_9GAMM|nr:cytochrome P450 [Spiribacter halobius]